MSRPERRRVVDPRTGRFSPTHAPSAASPSTEVEHQEAFAAAPPASTSPPGLTKKYGMVAAPSSLALKKKPLPSAAAAPPFMPMRAASKKREVRKGKKTAPAPAGSSSSTSKVAPAVEKCVHCTMGNKKSCLRTACTCVETAAGISNPQKKPEMGRMFLGVDEKGGHLSTGSNVRSSRSSQSEKSMSPEVTSGVDMKNLNKLLENMEKKWDTRKKELQDKLNELDRMIEQVQKMARECGADESTPDLWLGVLEIIHSERATKFFMESDPVGRMAIIKHYARVHVCLDVGGSQPGDIQCKSRLKMPVAWNKQYNPQCTGVKHLASPSLYVYCSKKPQVLVLNTRRLSCLQSTTK